MEQVCLVFEQHFYFKDKVSHSMNAFVHNECEYHFINAIKNLNKYLYKPIQIEILPSEEGGFKSKHIIRVSQTIGIVLLTSFANSFFDSKFRPKLHITEEIKTINYNQGKTEKRYFVNTIIDSGTQEDGKISLNPKVNNRSRPKDIADQISLFEDYK